MPYEPEAVHKLINQNKNQAERIRELEQGIGEALALAKAEWKVRNNHPASNWAKEVEYFKQVLKG